MQRYYNEYTEIYKDFYDGFLLPPTPPGREMCCAILNTDFFSIKYCIIEYDEEKLDQLRFGRYSYGVIVKKSIPFFLLEFEEYNFKKKWNMMAGINIRGIPFVQDVNSWMSKENRLVNIYLYDAFTGENLVSREIKIRHKVVKKIKDACSDQDEEYYDKPSIDIAMDNIERKFTADELLDRARKKDKLYNSWS